MKRVKCPCCGAAMRRNGRTGAGAQRWRCESCGATRTVSYEDSAARLEEFLAWLLSKATQAGMPGRGRTFRRLAVDWLMWLYLIGHIDESLRALRGREAPCGIRSTPGSSPRSSGGG